MSILFPNVNADFLKSTENSVGNFTGPFSGIIWAYHYSFGGVFVFKGQYGSDGWYVQSYDQYGWTFTVNSPSATQSYTTAPPARLWTCLGWSLGPNGYNVYSDGNSTGSAACSYPATSTENFNIGNYANSGFPVGADLADCALWREDLTQGEFQELARGAAPSEVRGHALDNWWPLLGTQKSKEPDIVGGHDLTIQGTVGPGAAGDPPLRSRGYRPRLFPVGTPTRVLPAGRFQAVTRDPYPFEKRNQQRIFSQMNGGKGPFLPYDPRPAWLPVLGQ